MSDDPGGPIIIIHVLLQEPTTGKEDKLRLERIRSRWFAEKKCNYKDRFFIVKLVNRVFCG